jgi:tRNA pseudouridine38-40 synthase
MSPERGRRTGGTLKLTLAYDGAEFHGWARQPGLRTVQGELERAVAAVWAEPAGLAVAGRTDAGVHASGPVASLRVDGGPPSARVPAALNRLLPEDVAVLACEAVPETFHARFSALARVYRYRVLTSALRDPLRRGRVLHEPRPVDEGALADCADLLVGEHDFRAFTPTETQHDGFRRIVESAAWRREGDELVFEIAADSFLRHMVRTLVGTMLEIARGERERSRFAELLAGAERPAAGATAPAHALCLVAVRYPGDVST